MPVSRKATTRRCLLAHIAKDDAHQAPTNSRFRRSIRIKARIEAIGADYMRLDGQVPQKKYAQLISRFQNDADCRIICMTNAGSTGLNLQAANTVINVDLPWNPAVLEQRIARAYRMGQRSAVQIYKLVTVSPDKNETIEERLLDTLAAKQDLADASINLDSDVNEVAVKSGMEDLKRRLEVVLQPSRAPIDESQQRRVEAEARELANKREKVSQASGNVITAALSLAGELIDSRSTTTADPSKVNKLAEKLAECVDRDAKGRPQLTISLPNDESLKSLATTVAKLLDD